MSPHNPHRINGSAVAIGEFTSGSEQWHAARANGLGGSEVSALLGLNPWESRWTLWYRKKDRLAPIRENLYMTMGSLFEPVIFEHYRDSLVPAGHTITTGVTYRHHQREWMIANPDGLIWDSEGNLVDGLEIKCAARDDKWGEPGTDQIPIYYRCQVAWYCAVMGLKGMWVRVVFGVGDWRTYRVEPTAEEIDLLINAGAEFMDTLARDVEPDLDDHTATYVALKSLHPLIDGSSIQVSAELADRWWEAQAAAEAAEAEVQRLRTQLLARMGLAWRAMCGDQKVAYRQRPRGGGPPFVKSAKRPEFCSITTALRGIQ
ncbi:YqaJ viral recombinase family protein [Nocardia asteroides]|uniref:YqaJ viral recombinase family protein n=1 Tax=Nocardia asteroides TaxID=1824 RepID=UPI0037C7249E